MGCLSTTNPIMKEHEFHVEGTWTNKEDSTWMIAWMIALKTSAFSTWIPRWWSTMHPRRDVPSTLYPHCIHRINPHCIHVPNPRIFAHYALIQKPKYFFYWVIVPLILHFLTLDCHLYWYSWFFVNESCTPSFCAGGGIRSTIFWFNNLMCYPLDHGALV